MKRSKRNAADATRLSPREWDVMDLLWTKSPQAAYDIAQALQGSLKWHPNTVRTMLARLLKKGCIEAQRYKNLFLYSPVVTREDCVAAESSSFLERVFGGAIKPALIHFAGRQELSDADIRELKEILEQRQKGKTRE